MSKSIGFKLQITMVKIFEDDFAVSIAMNSIKISSFTIVEETMVVTEISWQDCTNFDVNEVSAHLIFCL